MSMTMNKSFTILFGIIGIYWILSSILQQGSFLLLIPGILSLVLILPIKSNRYIENLIFPTLLYNLVLTSYQTYSSSSILLSRLIGIEIFIFLFNLILTLCIIYLIFQTLRSMNIDIS